MLVTLKEIMKYAQENQYAVGSFNTPSLEAVEAVISAAEESGLPVIIQHAQCHEHIVSLRTIGPVMLEAARNAAVPVCVHLDHGETLTYLEEALRIGFTSIMYDGSVLPYEENLANTKMAVAMAAETGAGVEAELGTMGRRESGETGGACLEEGDGIHAGGADPDKIYTDPALAGRFVHESGIDALACSFGTTHGIYLTEPKLDFDVVRQVRRETSGIPVVMHGGSGVSREDFRKAIEAGVRKINYFTYMDKAGGAAARELTEQIDRAGNRPLFYTDILMAARNAMEENVKKAIKVFSLR